VAEGRANKLKIEEEVTDKIRVVALHGALDMESAESLQGRLAGGAADPSRALVVDLTDCDFIDSVGLSALLQGAKPLQNGESNVAFVAPGGLVRRLLELTAVDRTIPVFDTREDACTSVLEPG
jgi:anti-sigma B factor antagonist